MTPKRHVCTTTVDQSCLTSILCHCRSTHRGALQDPLRCVSLVKLLSSPPPDPSCPSPPHLSSSGLSVASEGIIASPPLPVHALHLDIEDWISIPTLRQRLIHFVVVRATTVKRTSRLWYRSYCRSLCAQGVYVRGSSSAAVSVKKDIAPHSYHCEVDFSMILGGGFVHMFAHKQSKLNTEC